MNNRVIKSALCLAVIGMLILTAPAAFAKYELPKMKTVSYEAWNLQVDVPQQSVKKALPRVGETQLLDLFTYDDFVYFVKITDAPKESLTSTAIEQDIQATANYSARLGETKRWELDSRQKALFKGLSHYVKPDEDTPEEAVEFGQVLKGRTGMRAVAMAPVSDESSPILSVGVLGPKGRDSEIEAMAKFMAYGVTTTKPTAKPAPKPAPTVPVVQPKPAPPKPPAQIRPPALKKGQIQLEGVVQSVDTSAKSVVLSVDKIALPGQKPLVVTPRFKQVLLKKMPEGLAGGARLTVIGKNEGVGTPITADWFQKLPAL